MYVMASRESHVKLETSEANRLGKWGSLWFDLQHVVMVLDARLNTLDKPENTFVRRALWESAVVSYGRMAASDRKRKLDHENLLCVAGGSDALAFHEQVMRWRHDHVAHRLSKDFEAVEVVAYYEDGEAARPDAIGLNVSTWTGPKDDAIEAVQFREHVTLLRDTLWVEYLAPVGESIVRRERMEAAPDAESERRDADRITANLTLWSRTNGTGL